MSPSELKRLARRYECPWCKRHNPGTSVCRWCAQHIFIALNGEIKKGPTNVRV